MAKLVVLFSVMMLAAFAAAGDDATTIPADATTTLSPGNDTAPAALAGAELARETDAAPPASADAAPPAPSDAALAPGDSADQPPKTATQGSR